MKKEDEQIKENIDSIIHNTFKAIQEVYTRQMKNSDSSESKEASRIIFPKKRKGETRISEKELRFVFVEQLNKKIANGNGWNVFYSVETPTNDTYRFSNIKEPRQDSTGRSGNFDLVIHDANFVRIALIEFKANYCPIRGYHKDFKKLNNSDEKGVLRYFIQIVENHNKRTISSIHDKIGVNKGIFRCWSLKKGEEITDDIQNNQSE